MTIIIIVVGIIVGVLVGLNLPIIFSGGLAVYISVIILATIDSLLGGLRASLQSKFDLTIFVSGLVANASLALLLSFAGDNLGLPLYYAALFVFGTRLFENTSIIRRILLKKYEERKNDQV